jgi:outer membrane protein TolC
MRLYQQFRASISRSAMLSTLSAGVLLFASGMSVSASGQTQAGSTPAQAAPPASQEAALAPGTPVSIEEAVRMALENNLGIQIEKLNPQIQVLGVSRARAVYAPSLLTGFTRRNSSSPPQDFTTSGADQAISTSANFGSNGGLQQQMKWGGNYSVVFDGSRFTSNAINSRFNPQLGSNLNASFNQPLLRNFKIDANRQQVLLAKNQLQAADLQLQQRLTQTGRSVRAAYYALVGAIAGLEVAQESLNLSRTSLKNNQTRVEVGTMAPIDIVTAEAEVASNEENVIITQGQIESAQDQLRTLIMNPTQADFWSARFTPSEQPVLTARVIDIDGAIKNALANRTDILAFKKQMESTDINLKYAANQKLPAIDLNARYGLTGTAGSQLLEDRTLPPIIRSFGDSLRDVFANEFKTWSVAINVSYPLGTSPAEAAFAQAKLQQQQEHTSLASLEMQVTTAVREAGRQVNTNLKRVEATRKARDLAQQRLDAENKRFTVGLSSTFELLQAQRDLSRAKQNELNATIDYNLSLIDFEAVQIAPIR